jgi:hypothetical protein
MDQYEEAMNIFPSFGFQYMKQLPYSKKPVNFWHPGYAWACTRKTYESLGGLYEEGILGSGDNIMALSFVQKVDYAINESYNEDYKKSMYEYQKRAKTLRIGYVPGIIRHYYHGSKKNRNYTNRWKMLVEYNYSPSEHVTRDENGILVPTEACPKGLLEDIQNYFKSRNDDEMYEGGDYSKRIKNFSNIKSTNSINSLNSINSIINMNDLEDNQDNDNNDSTVLVNADKIVVKQETIIKTKSSGFLTKLFNVFESFINPCDTPQK